jgi:hypothetical protein
VHSFLKFIFGIKLYMFRTVPLSIIRSFSLYTQQWYKSANLYGIYHCCIYIKELLMMDRGTVRNIFWLLLTVHLSIFISVFNQLDAQNLFYNKFYFMPLYVSSTCAHHQEVKIALHSLWYHHTYRCDTRGCVMQFWPPGDEHMCSKHVEAWNKTYCKTNFVHRVG